MARRSIFSSIFSFELLVAISVKDHVSSYPFSDKIITVGTNSGILWEQIDYPLYAKKHGYICINLCGIPLLKPDICIIHDMIIRDHPEFYSLLFVVSRRLMYFFAVHHAKKILTISEFSRERILYYYSNLKNKDLYVIGCGWQHMNLIQEDNDTLKRYGLNTNDFYFCIGSRSPNKNIKWVIKLAQAMQNDIFVVAGANEKIFSSENIDNHAKNVRFIGYTTDEETKALMSNCKAFLFPSIYEGFGMPPLEAMGSGCTSVYVSDIQVMHEIYSNFVSYIDLHVCSLPSVNASTGNIALLEKYSWKSSAKILLDCFHE